VESWDAYGRALLDRYEDGRAGEEIVEREDGFFYLGAGPSFYLAPCRDWGPLGQAEVLGRKLGGVTVHAGARVMSKADPRREEERAPRSQASWPARQESH
jgi:hypothetical protein